MLSKQVLTNVYAPPTASPDARKIDPVNCASRWRRIGALCADLFLCLIVVGILMLFAQGSALRALCLVPVQGFVFPLYRFYTQGSSGQTFGQRLLRIRVVRTRGGAIGFGAAARLALSPTLISIPSIVTRMIVVAQVPPPPFKVLETHHLAFAPDFWKALLLLAGLIVLPELASFLFSARRQTLSDLFADTVVVDVEKYATGAHHD